jgi:hypothetical protein
MTSARRGSPADVAGQDEEIIRAFREVDGGAKLTDVAAQARDRTEAHAEEPARLGFEDVEVGHEADEFAGLERGLRGSADEPLAVVLEEALEPGGVVERSLLAVDPPQAIAASSAAD